MEEQQEQQVLHTYVRHAHEPKNINRAQKEQQKQAGLNTRIAVGLTKAVGTMPTAYLFTLLSLVGLLGLLGYLPANVFLLCTWLSQMFLQLVMLPIISVGQGVLGQHTELMAEEQFQTTQKSYHDIEQIMEHLSKQDAEILRLSRQNTLILKSLEQSRSRIVKSGTRKAKREQITQEVEAVLTKSLKEHTGSRIA